MSREVVVVSAKRTPQGAFQGCLSSIPAPTLAATVFRGILSEHSVDVDEVILGNVLSAGIGQSPARQATIGAGLPDTTPSVTVNKVCGSGLQALVYAAQSIALGDYEVALAGGSENMSLVPYLLPQARSGARMGHGKMIDALINDGLWDVYNNCHMGECAEALVSKNSYTREALDEFAAESFRRAQKAQEEGRFASQIIPVEVPQRRGAPVMISVDECPSRVDFEKMKQLRPAFVKDGAVTAANASQISDGAAGVLVMSKEKAKELNMEPLVKIVSYASAARESKFFTLAPVKAVEKALQKAGLCAEDIDLWEVNEAFAPVPMALIDHFKIDSSRVNVDGGAISLGHPLGTSGARVLVALIHAMKRLNARRGLATLCIGGGEGIAMIVEQL